MPVVCVCVKSHFYGLIHFSASSHAHEVPPSYCCFYTIFLYVWFTCDAASYIPKALTRRQQQIATNNSAFFSLFFSLRSFVFVSCVVVVVAIFDVCRQNLNTYSRPKPFARYRILWRQFIRIIAVMRLCFFLCWCCSLFTYPSQLIQTHRFFLSWSFSIPSHFNSHLIGIWDSSHEWLNQVLCKFLIKTSKWKKKSNNNNKWIELK